MLYSTLVLSPYTDWLSQLHQTTLHPTHMCLRCLQCGIHFRNSLIGHEDIDDIYHLVVAEFSIHLKFDDYPLKRVLWKGLKGWGGVWALGVFGALFFLMAFTMLVRDVAILNIPCLAETQRDFGVLLVEGPALLVHLHLVGGGDGDGKLVSMPRSLSLLLLNAIGLSEL